MTYTKVHPVWHDDVDVKDTPVDAPAMNHIEDGIEAAATTADTVTTQLGVFNSLVRTGVGSPEGVVTASPSTLWLRTNGGPGTTLYVKESGTGNTGWIVHPGGFPAKTATTVAGLGTPLQDGALGIVRVGTFPDQADVFLRWNATAAKWISDPIALVGQTDQGYLATTSATYTYMAGTAGANGTATQTGWYSRSLVHAGALWTAGLRLQCQLTGVITGNGTTDTGSVTFYLFQHDPGDVIVTISGSSPINQIAQGPVVTGGTGGFSQGVNGGYFVSSGWTDITFGTNPSKKHVWPQVYIKKNGTVSGTAIQAIDFDIQARWVG